MTKIWFVSSLIKRSQWSWRGFLKVVNVFSRSLLSLFLFVLFWVLRPPREFFPHIEMYRRRASKVYLCSALMAIEQWGFLNVQHLQWHRTSVYNGHLRGLVTLTPVAEHLAVELSLTYGCRDWDSNTQPSPCRANTVTDCATAVVIIFVTTFTSLLLNKCFCEIE